jgi:hypothetical protein
VRVGLERLEAFGQRRQRALALLALVLARHIQRLQARFGVRRRVLEPLGRGQ